MRVVFTPPAEIHMEPQTERDQLTIEKLEAAGLLAGFGRHAGTGEYLHAQVELSESQRLEK